MKDTHAAIPHTPLRRGVRRRRSYPAGNNCRRSVSGTRSDHLPRRRPGELRARRSRTTPTRRRHCRAVPPGAPAAPWLRARAPGGRTTRARSPLPRSARAPRTRHLPPSGLRGARVPCRGSARSAPARARTGVGLQVSTRGPAGHSGCRALARARAGTPAPHPSRTYRRPTRRRGACKAVPACCDREPTQDALRRAVETSRCRHQPAATPPPLWRRQAPRPRRLRRPEPCVVTAGCQRSRPRRRR